MHLEGGVASHCETHSARGTLLVLTAFLSFGARAAPSGRAAQTCYCSPARDRFASHRSIDVSGYLGRRPMITKSGPRPILRQRRSV